MSDFTFEIAPGQSIEKQINLGKLSRLLKSTLVRSGVFHTREIKTNRFVRYHRGQSAKLKIRTGNLRASVGYEVKGSAIDSLTLGLRATSPQALIQETGGTVRPTRRQYLTIPLDAALTPAGALSGKYLLRQVGKKWVTDAGPTFIRKGVIFAASAGGQVVPIYVLKKSVRIPPRFDFVRTFKRVTIPFVEKELQRVATATVAQGPA